MEVGMENKTIELKTVANESAKVIMDLQERDFKPTEIMAICLAASKTAESLILTQGIMASFANALVRK